MAPIVAAFAAASALFVAGTGWAQTGLYEAVSGRLEEKMGVAPAAAGEVAAPEGSRTAAEGGARPAAARRRAPPEARAFVPDYMTRAAPDSLWPMTDAVSREMVDAIVERFRAAYPDVVYHIDWEDETANAYAWRANGQRHVQLLGGLIRHRALFTEGIGLVLAHELGHHYGGPPTYSSGLSCEGQADYWGAGTAMRGTWGDAYAAQMEPAIGQVFAFFSKGVITTATPDEIERIQEAGGGCAHPPAACRKQTYEAAFRGEPKPECAGPTENPALTQAPASEAPAAAVN